MTKRNNAIIVIEVDGQQHYSIRRGKNKEAFDSLRDRDAYKNKYCEDNNIKLIRIPYAGYHYVRRENSLSKSKKGRSK